MNPRLTLAALMLCISISSIAQSKKQLFSNKPSQFICQETTLANVFNAQEGQNVTLSCNNDVVLTGKVISQVQKYHNLSSVTIELPDYQNAILCISKQILNDKSINYVGRILQDNAADGYVIEKMGNSYTFNKINTEKLVETCH